ncbi:hypothetical protein IV49_GL000120 [Kandleria vitulina DSM 20405]|uniref:Uncharacterized protein n=1 Tax=Kandleria vitulina DSM 20405 TaxID=1410657 RepID=A0A0R2HEJ9_9FIRM|nr:hypothetical protein [Kandleria vitulina]KRN51503.1 hypothetical protein IV49_GL000120 [Kandleria vitulina DSM 20405]
MNKKVKHIVVIFSIGLVVLIAFVFYKALQDPSQGRDIEYNEIGIENYEQFWNIDLPSVKDHIFSLSAIDTKYSVYELSDKADFSQFKKGTTANEIRNALEEYTSSRYKNNQIPKEATGYYLIKENDGNKIYVQTDKNKLYILEINI